MAWAYHGRGTAWMKKAEMGKAIDDFTRAIERDPKLAWAYFNRGLARVYIGDEGEAQKDFDECLRMRPDLQAQLEAKIELARQLRSQK
jgi:tetratricopeptide (TPR) repeat protein